MIEIKHPCMNTYLFLLFVCFISATLIPFSSEIVFASFVWMGHSPVLAILIASLGNCAGVTVNYLLGRYGTGWFVERFFKLDPARLNEFSLKQKKYGIWFLLASWLPVIGDPITLYAGVVRIPFLRFALWAYSTRTVRYVILYFIVVGLK